MAIKFLSLSKKFKTVRPKGFKFPNGLSYGSGNNTNSGVTTEGKSSGGLLELNEVSGPTSNSVLTFNSSGIFRPAFTGDVEILVVGAGGAGGPGNDRGGGGGGGAGGVRYVSGQPVIMDTSYTVTVGGGGAVSPPSYHVAVVSSWSGSESNVAPVGVYGSGGGGGGKAGAPNPFPAYIAGGPSPISNGSPGASGGGGSSPGYSSSETTPAGSANTTGGQLGFPGTSGAALAFYNEPAYGNGGGGGGASQAGQARANVNSSSPGGDGVQYSISGTSIYYGGGGGGGGSYVANNAPDRYQYYIGFGGEGGGGEGGMCFSTDHLPQPARLIAGTAGGPQPFSANQQLAVDLTVGVAGTINRGGGGGGGGALQPNAGGTQPPVLVGSGSYALAGAGGSGTVIFRFNTFHSTSNTFSIN